MTRRKLIALPIAAIAIGASAFGISAMEANNRELHDLSVIGQGRPVIVQIHDPSCPTCRRLKSVVTNTIKSEPSVQYRLADITTTEGKALQTKYSVPTITLLYFDERGKHVHTARGLQSSGDVQLAIEQIL